MVKIPNKKSTKGITLIALVITIIVLLILAGVTIAMLTGSDSAPAKANEAKQKNDIGAARDQVYLTASNAQTEAYETVYVKGKKTDNSGDNVTAGGAGAEVSNYVKSEIKKEYGTAKKVGSASIVSSADGETITISTTDFKDIGTVSATGGTLSWSGVQENNGSSTPVTPATKTLSSIAITAAPDKTSYTAGETLDLTGIEVTATYSNSTTSVVTTTATYSPADGATLNEVGTTTITASYTEGGVTKTATTNVTVSAPASAGTPITTAISSTNYGQYIDLGTHIFGDNKKIGNLGSENEDVLADWRILYKDTNGIWVILADYYPMTDAMATATGLTRVSGTTYNVNSSNQNNLIAGLTSSGWSSLTNKGTVVGGVEAEVLMSSYNQKNGTNLAYTSYPTLSSSDTLYVPHYSSSSAYGGCYGYWLASRYGSYNVWYVDCSGYVDHYLYNSASGGVRPAVYLDSNVQVTSSGTGASTVWTVQ